MSIFIPGKSRCSICGNIINENQKYIGSKFFIDDESDPFWRFSDSNFHYDCFINWDLKVEFLEKYKRAGFTWSPDDCEIESQKEEKYGAKGETIKDIFFTAESIPDADVIRHYKGELLVSDEQELMSKLVEEAEQLGANLVMNFRSCITLRTKKNNLIEIVFRKKEKRYWIVSYDMVKI